MIKYYRSILLSGNFKVVANETSHSYYIGNTLIAKSILKIRDIDVLSEYMRYYKESEGLPFNLNEYIRFSLASGTMQLHSDGIIFNSNIIKDGVFKYNDLGDFCIFNNGNEVVNLDMDDIPYQDYKDDRNFPGDEYQLKWEIAKKSNRLHVLFHHENDFTSNIKFINELIIKMKS